jgi:hypothetical protein
MIKKIFKEIIADLDDLLTWGDVDDKARNQITSIVNKMENYAASTWGNEVITRDRYTNETVDIKKSISLLLESQIKVIDIINSHMGGDATDCGGDFSEECSPYNCTHYYQCKTRYDLNKELTEVVVNLKNHISKGV